MTDKLLDPATVQGARPEGPTAKTTSAFLSPLSSPSSRFVSRVQVGAGVGGAADLEGSKEGAPAAAGGATSTLSELLRTGGARLAVTFDDHHHHHHEEEGQGQGDQGVRVVTSPAEDAEGDESGSKGPLAPSSASLRDDDGAAGSAHSTSHPLPYPARPSAPPTPTRVGPAAAPTALPDSLTLAKKIASMLRPGPPFFSEMDNAELVGLIGDEGVMNGDAGILPDPASGSGGAVGGEGEVGVSVQEHGNGDGAGQGTQGPRKQSVWDALDSLPVGATWAQIPYVLARAPPSNLAPPPTHGKSNNEARPEDGGRADGLIDADGDDGLWTALMLTCDLPTFVKKSTETKGLAARSSTTTATKAKAATTTNNDDDAQLLIDTASLNVRLGRSVVIPTRVLREHGYFDGNSAALGRTILIGDGRGYTWDDFSSPSTRRGTTVAGGASELWGGGLAGLPLLSLWSWPSWVPFLGHQQHQDEGKAAPPGPAPGPGPGPDAKEGQKRVWVPSSTRVSFLACWWGFRLYLPPPVMKSLTEDLGTTESIARVMSTVLSFLLTHIPTAAIPLPLLPLVTVLQAIAPLTGYLATFIAWSWRGICARDKGYGVVLSATWIMPVAIIPSALPGPPLPMAPVTPAPITPTPAPAPTPAPTPTPAAP